MKEFPKLEGRLMRSMDHLISRIWWCNHRAGGVTLDGEACEILLRWWDWWESISSERKEELTPKRRGRAEPTRMLDYMEAEAKRSEIVAKTGKEHGSGKLVNHAMAKRWRMDNDDAARKRIDAAYKALGKQRG